MFKTILNNLVSIFTVPNIPLLRGNVPNSFLTFLCMSNDKFNPDADLYRKTIFDDENHLIYIVYSGHMESPIYYDLLYWKGHETGLLVISDIIYEMEPDNVISIMIGAAYTVDNLHKTITGKLNLSKFYSNKSFTKVEYFAPYVLAVALPTSIYYISDAEESLLAEKINMIFGTDNGEPVMTQKKIHSLVEDVQIIGVESLLDNSYIIGEICAFTNEEEPKETECDTENNHTTKNDEDNCDDGLPIE